MEDREKAQDGNEEVEGHAFEDGNDEREKADPGDEVEGHAFRGGGEEGRQEEGV